MLKIDISEELGDFYKNMLFFKLLVDDFLVRFKVFNFFEVNF